MPASSLHNEKELFAQIATGDETAFEKVFHTYNAKLLPFVFSITKNREAAEEIMQEVFLKIWLQRDKLTTIEQPAAWLVRLCSNMALSYIQRQAIHAKVMDNLAHQSQTDAPTIEADLHVKEIQQHIATAISQLPDKRQQIYRLSRQEGLNRKEIADKLGLSESTVKNQLSSALKFIQDYLQEQTGIYLPLFILATII